MRSEVAYLSVAAINSTPCGVQQLMRSTSDVLDFSMMTAGVSYKESLPSGFRQSFAIGEFQVVSFRETFEAKIRIASLSN